MIRRFDNFNESNKNEKNKEDDFSILKDEIRKIIRKHFGWMCFTEDDPIIKDETYIFKIATSRDINYSSPDTKDKVKEDLENEFLCDISIIYKGKRDTGCGGSEYDYHIIFRDLQKGVIKMNKDFDMFLDED